MSTEPQPTTDLLRRILEAVGPPKRKRGLGVACAVILALDREQEIRALAGLLTTLICPESSPRKSRTSRLT